MVMRNPGTICALLWLSAVSLQAQELGLRESKEFSGLGEYIMQAEFSPFRNYFAYTIGDNTIRVYDRDWEKVFEHQGNPKAVGGVFVFSPDEKYLAYGRYKGFNDIAIIRLEDMKVTGVLNRHTDYINHLEFSHEGNLLVSTSSDRQAIIWELRDESFQFSQVFTGFESSLNQSSFSHDDRFLVTGDSRGHVLVLVRNGNAYREFQKFQFRKHAIESVAFHPGKDEFVTGSSYGLRRYRLQHDAFVLTDSVEDRASVSQPVHFSPDGEYLALGNYQTAVIFRVDADSIYPVETVYQHMDHVFGATFSDDGEFFATYSSDQRIIIWEIDHVQPSDKARVVSWLGTDLSLAQKRSLTPATIMKIMGSVDPKLTLPRDEFETSAEFNVRMEKLADWALGVLQEEMEKRYRVKERAGRVELPLQGLVGYNADLQIYKIRFMETEAGVAIPVPAARKFKEQWRESHIRATREPQEDRKSYRYSDFELYHPSDKTYYPVTPMENPFFREEKQEMIRTTVVPNRGKDRDSVPGLGTTYALMFASNVYDFYPDLVNPVLDAQTIALELGENYGVITEVILNPTLSETASVIREYASRSYDPEDNLMVFFAGHGVYDEVFREGYVISRDSRMDDLGKTSYLSHSNLRTMINNIGCPHIFLVMDVCFGGTFDPHLASTHRGSPAVYADISTQEFVERKLKYKTRLYLTSGGKEYVPDGRPGFHSPFARRFIESLRYYGGEDGVLTTSEILQFVEKVNPQPRFGEFGDNEPGSDFILVVK
jgi:WD40 repeat protein